jgi:hypothetical protein
MRTMGGHESDVSELGKRYETEITIVADLTGCNEGELVISRSVLTQVALMSTGLCFYWLYSGRDNETPTDAKTEGSPIVSSSGVSVDISVVENEDSETK